MKNYKKHLETLNFHDSDIQSISIEENDMFDRKLIVKIDYYNWEGNMEESDSWITKTLQITINHCVHLQFNAPNLMEDAFEILSEEFDLMYDDFVNKALKEKASSYFVNLNSKQLNNFLSLKFNLRNYGDSLFDETNGFIWIAGFNVHHEWLDESIVNKKHISI